MDRRLDFRILGPLSVTSDDEQLTVGGPRHRTVLALLLLNPGRVVSVDALIDTVWDGRPPATARTQVSMCVAGLRKAFKAAGHAEEIIATEHPGYRLRLGGHRLDATEFTSLVAAAELAVEEGRSADAARCYNEALGLWRGQPLAGVTGRLVEGEARRLEELRLDTYEGSTAVQLQLGNHGRILSELTAMVRDHPLRERARHQLITAQYRSGRRAEALETFREGRRRFVDEFGLEPGPALWELHNSILQDEPAAAADFVLHRETAAEDRQAAAVAAVPVGTPSQLPPDVSSLTGRKDELAQLDAQLAEGAGLRGPATGLITGVAGVGKTCLAVHWAHTVAERFPDGQLFADLRGYSEHLEPVPADQVLGRFLRSLSVPDAQIPADPDERAALYRSMLADRQVLVVLDNVRSYEQVRPLLPSGGGCCVVVTSRQQLPELVAWPPDSWVRLRRLPGYEAVELLDTIVGDGRVTEEPCAAELLVDLCDLLPLALRIAGARLAAKPHWTVAHLVQRLSDERQRLNELSQGDSQVRSSFALSYRYLSEPAARLYRSLGMLDLPDFSAWVGAALLNTGLYDAERLIEQLVDAQLLDVAGRDTAGHPRYRFQNLLRLFARERAEEQDGPTERRAALERVFQAYLHVAERAHQRCRGGDFGIIHSPVRRLELPEGLTAQLLSGPLDWLEAERPSLVAVILQAAELGLDEIAWDLTLSSAVLFERRNYLDDWRRCGERSLSAARRAGNVRGEAAMLQTLGALAGRSGDPTEAYGCYTTALALYEQADERHGRALTLRQMALIDRDRGELETAMERGAEALDVFRTVGDLASEAEVLDQMAQIELSLGRPDRARVLGLESARLGGALAAGPLLEQRAREQRSRGD